MDLTLPNGIFSGRSGFDATNRRFARAGRVSPLTIFPPLLTRHRPSDVSFARKGFGARAMATISSVEGILPAPLDEDAENPLRPVGPTLADPIGRPETADRGRIIWPYALA